MKTSRLICTYCFCCCRDVLFRKDRGHGAFGLARAAVDALVRMDVQLLRTFVDTVHRADVDARFVLRTTQASVMTYGIAGSEVLSKRIVWL